MANTKTVTLNNGQTVVRNVPVDIVRGDPRMSIYMNMTEPGEYTFSPQQGATSKTVSLNNGAVKVKGVPVDVSPNDPRMAEYMKITQPGEYTFSQTPQTQPSTQTAGTPVGTQPPKKPNLAQRIIGNPKEDFKEGVDATVRGAVPLLSAEMISTPIVNTINKLTGKNYQTPADGMRDLLAGIGINAPESANGKLVELLSEVVIETASTAGAGTALKAGKNLAPTVQKGVGKVLAAAPGAQLGGGLGATTGTELAAQADLPVPAQIGAGLIGGALGGSTSNLKQIKVPKAPLKEAAELGVDMLTSDVIKPNSFMSKWAQSVGEKIPFSGTGSRRAVQQTQRIKAIQNTMAEFGVDDLTDLSEDLMNDVFKKYKGRLSGLSEVKMGVINKLSKEGDIVPVDNVIKSIDSKIANIDSLNDKQLDSLRSLLVNKKEALQGQNLSNVEVHRGLIGDFFDTNKDNKAIQRLKKDIIEGEDGLYAAVNKDMESYIKANGDPKDFTKWKTSNKEMSNILKEADNTALKTVLNKGGEQPEQVMKMLMKREQSTLNSLNKNLTPKGRVNARNAILMNAMETAGFDKDTGYISPEKFTNALKSKSLKKQVDTFFKGEDKKTLDGLTRVLDATRRAGEAKVLPKTGVQAVPYLTAGVAAKAAEMLGMQGTEGILATGGIVLGTGGLASIYESKPVRNLLVKLATSKPGTPGEAELMRLLTDTLTGIKETDDKQQRSIPKEQ